MEMKEFHYEDGLRVSLFNLDHESVPFHFHREVSDMMYCARGRITIELPDSGRVVGVEPDQVFQVPSPARHRFVNGAPPGTLSRYVLLQIGSFDITFIDDGEQPSLPEPAASEGENGVVGVVYIEDRRDDIRSLADRFERERPGPLNAQEQADVVSALRALASRGRAQAHPRAYAST